MDSTAPSCSRLRSPEAARRRRRAAAPLLVVLALGVAPLHARAYGQDGPGASLGTAVATPELRSLEAAIGRHELAQAADLKRRDSLLRRLRSLEDERGWPKRIVGSWERQGVKRELEALIATLELRRGRLLQLKERRELVLARSETLDWEQLDALVAEAAASWKSGGGDDPETLPAVARVLERAGAAPGDASFERYRALVARLAKVNETIAGLPVSEEFLGVGERGATTSLQAAPSREVWVRLRSRLASEIVVVATELTRRAHAAAGS